MNDVDELVAEAARRDLCPTVSWGLVVDGRLASHGAVGTVHAAACPTADTVYRIASMTKSFTAAAVLSLRDDGVLSLDDPIVAHAPEFARLVPPTTDAPPVTVRHLLSMASGMATDDAWADRHLDITAAELDTAVAAGALWAAVPGTTWEYSNLGYGLLGRIVERLTDAPVQHLVSERFLGPLGMTRTTWVRPDHDDWARPHFQRDGRAVADEREPLGDGGIAPMGGLWTNVTDLATWVAFLDDAWPPRDDHDTGPLSRASRREMQQIQRYAGLKRLSGVDAPTGYGFGLLVRDDPTLGHVVGHSGGLPGYGSNMRWVAGRRVGMIALANVTYAPMSELTHSVLLRLAELGQLPAAAPQHAPLVGELGRRLVDLLEHWDDDTARQLFTDNVEMDDPFERRRAAAARLVESCGGRLRLESIDATSATAGSVVVSGTSSARIAISFQVAPVPPPRIQLYEITTPDGSP